MSVSSPELFSLQEKIESLRSVLLEKSPRLPTLLREIHTALRQHPENVTLLAEEDILAVVNGLQAQTNVHFAATALKSVKSPSTATKIKRLSADDF